MRSPGDIVLLSCYESGHQPLAVAWPLAHLRHAGFSPVAIDLAVGADDAPGVLSRARLVAISVPMHTALRLGIRAAAKIRELNPRATICFYGLYAPLFRDQLARVADHVLGAEPEVELVKLSGAMSEAHGMSPPTPDEAEGVPWFRSQSDARPSRRLPLITPDRDGLPALDKYARLLIAGERRPAGYTEASRGCKHMCRHCPVPAVYGGRFTAVPVELVMSDIRRQVAAGARHITFGDADFLNGPRHAVAVAEALHVEFPAVTWDATIKVEHLLAERHLLARFAALGCVFIVSAFESLSDRMLAILDKGHTAAGATEALHLTRAAGISLRPSFVPFTPWTTLDDYLTLCRFLFDHHLVHEVDPVQLSLRLLVPPGSLLLDHPEMRPHLGAFDPEAATWRWTHPDPRLDHLAAAVATLVEQSTTDGLSAPAILSAIHDLALTVSDPGASTSARASADPIPLPDSAPPRLSEPWFC